MTMDEQRYVCRHALSPHITSMLGQGDKLVNYSKQ
jgi:hypothetical protein